MLRVCTSSTEDSLLSLASYKAAIGTTSTANDTALEAALRRATELVEGYIGYPLRRQVYYETVPGYGNNDLLVSRVPLRSIESIYAGTEIVDPDEYYVEKEQAGLIVREIGWPWTAGVEWDLQPHVVPGSELRSYAVTYEAGYCVNGSTADGWLTTGAAVPGDIEAAVTLAATQIYSGAGRDPAVASKSIGDLSISYQGAQSQGGSVSAGLSDTVKGMLSPWRRF